MIVTLWWRQNEDSFEFNHLSLGYHPDHEEPAYVSEAQRRAWSRSIWAPEQAELVNGEVKREA